MLLYYFLHRHGSTACEIQVRIHNMEVRARIGDFVGVPSAGIGNDRNTLAKSAVASAVRQYRESYGHPSDTTPVELDHCTLMMGDRNYKLGQLPVHQADQETAISNALRQISTSD